MRALDKLISDAARLEGRRVDDPAVQASLRSLFMAHVSGLPEAFAADAFGVFLDRAGGGDGVLGERDADRLAGIASAVAGDYDGAELDREDWTGIRDAANAAGDELPLDTLMSIMSLVTERGAIH